MARHTYRPVTFHEPDAGNLLAVDHNRSDKNAVVEGVVVSIRTLINDTSVKIEAELTREEALRYIRDIAERIGGPGFRDLLPVKL
jgi:hypothetical protein